MKTNALDLYRERFTKAIIHLTRCIEESPYGTDRLDSLIEESLQVGGLDLEYSPNWDALRAYAMAFKS